MRLINKKKVTKKKKRKKRNPSPHASQLDPPSIFSVMAFSPYTLFASCFPGDVLTDSHPRTILPAFPTTSLKTHTRRICFDWLKTGACHRGKDCLFDHISPNQRRCPLMLRGCCPWLEAQGTSLVCKSQRESKTEAKKKKITCPGLLVPEPCPYSHDPTCPSIANMCELCNVFFNNERTLQPIHERGSQHLNYLGLLCHNNAARMKMANFDPLHITCTNCMSAGHPYRACPLKYCRAFANGVCRGVCGLIHLRKLFRT